MTPVEPPIGWPVLPGHMKSAKFFREFPRDMMRGPDPEAPLDARVAWVQVMLGRIVEKVGGAAQLPTVHPVHWAVPVPGFVLRFELQPPMPGGKAWTAFGLFEAPGASRSPRPDIFFPKWQFIGSSPEEFCMELQLSLTFLLEEPKAPIPDAVWLTPAPGPLDRYQLVPSLDRWSIQDTKQRIVMAGAAELLAVRRSAFSLNCSASLAWRTELRTKREENRR